MYSIDFVVVLTFLVGSTAIQDNQLLTYCGRRAEFGNNVAPTQGLFNEDNLPPCDESNVDILHPTSLVHDCFRNLLFISEGMLRVTVVNLQTKYVRRIPSQITDPMGMVFLNRNIYISQRSVHTIGVLDPFSDKFVIYCGKHNVSGFVNGNFSVSRFNEPTTLTSLPNSILLISDTGNGAVRRVSLRSKIVSTLFLSLQAPQQGSLTSVTAWRNNVFVSNETCVCIFSGVKVVKVVYYCKFDVEVGMLSFVFIDPIRKRMYVSDTEYQRVFIGDIIPTKGFSSTFGNGTNTQMGSIFGAVIVNRSLFLAEFSQNAILEFGVEYKPSARPANCESRSMTISHSLSGGNESTKSATPTSSLTAAFMSQSNSYVQTNEVPTVSTSTSLSDKCPGSLRRVEGYRFIKGAPLQAPAWEVDELAFETQTLKVDLYCATFLRREKLKINFPLSIACLGMDVNDTTCTYTKYRDKLLPRSKGSAYNVSNEENSMQLLITNVEDIDMEDKETWILTLGSVGTNVITFLDESNSSLYITINVYPSILSPELEMTCYILGIIVVVLSFFTIPMQGLEHQLAYLITHTECTRLFTKRMASDFILVPLRIPFLNQRMSYVMGSVVLVVGVNMVVGALSRWCSWKKDLGRAVILSYSGILWQSFKMAYSESQTETVIAVICLLLPIVYVVWILWRFRRDRKTFPQYVAYDDPYTRWFGWYHGSWDPLRPSLSHLHLMDVKPTSVRWFCMYPLFQSLMTAAIVAQPKMSCAGVYGSLIAIYFIGCFLLFKFQPRRSRFLNITSFIYHFGLVSITGAEIALRAVPGGLTSRSSRSIPGLMTAVLIIFHSAVSLYAMWIHVWESWWVTKNLWPDETGCHLPMFARAPTADPISVNTNSEMEIPLQPMWEPEKEEMNSNRQFAPNGDSHPWSNIHVPPAMHRSPDGYRNGPRGVGVAVPEHIAEFWKAKYNVYV